MADFSYLANLANSGRLRQGSLPAQPAPMLDDMESPDFGGLQNRTYSRPLQQDAIFDRGESDAPVFSREGRMATPWQARARGNAQAMRILDDIYGPGPASHEQIKQKDLQARQHMAAVDELLPAGPEGYPTQRVQITSGGKTYVPPEATQRASDLSGMLEAVPEGQITPDERVGILGDIERARGGETPVMPRGSRGFYSDSSQDRVYDRGRQQAEDAARLSTAYTRENQALQTMSDQLTQAIASAGADGAVLLPFELPNIPRQLSVDDATALLKKIQQQQQDNDLYYSNLGVRGIPKRDADEVFP